jgi:hypothetical protein
MLNMAYKGHVPVASPSVQDEFNLIPACRDVCPTLGSISLKQGGVVTEWDAVALPCGGIDTN